MDSREKNALKFDFPFVSEVVPQKLNAGDYGAVFENGEIAPVYFERKSKSDLFSTLLNKKNHERFKRELARAQKKGQVIIIIIEEPMSSIMKGTKHSSGDGLTLIKILFTMWLKYGLYPVYCKDRKEMSIYIYEYYCAIGRALKS